MQTAIALQSTELSATSIPKHNQEAFTPLALERVTRPTLNTEEAAYYLNRKPQSLRVWACYTTGPIKPLRINGRLAWPTASIKDLLGVK